MSKMIAYCGLVCSRRPVFLATQNDDDAAREKTAAFFSPKYGFDFKPETDAKAGFEALVKEIQN